MAASLFSEPDESGQPTGLRLMYFDQAGFDRSLPNTYSYSGLGQPLCVPRQRDKRLNVIGALDFAGGGLEYELLEGHCCAKDTVAFLERLSLECAQRPKQMTMVVLDNGSVNAAKAVRAQAERWKERGLHLGYLPTYSPHLNLIERAWRMIKYHLMPRRFYPSLTELRQALVEVLDNFCHVVSTV